MRASAFPAAGHRECSIAPGATQYGTTPNTSFPTKILLTTLVIPAEAGIQFFRPSGTGPASEVLAPRFRGGDTSRAGSRKRSPRTSRPRAVVVGAPLGASGHADGEAQQASQCPACALSLVVYPWPAVHSIWNDRNPVIASISMARRAALYGTTPNTSFPRKILLTTLVIPAEAGIQFWRPAFAEVTHRGRAAENGAREPLVRGRLSLPLPSVPRDTPTAKPSRPHSARSMRCH
jgi:hypothetical protein